MTISKRRRAGTLPAFAPVPRHYNRYDGWTPERQQRFIEALADTGSVKAAAHRVNMTPEGAYHLRRHPEAESFRKAWEAALALGVQQLEDVAMERALHGQEVPVYSYGQLIGSRIVHNDRLLMFLLKNRAPTRFAADGSVTQRRSSIGNPQEANRMSRLKQQWRKEWEEEQHERQAKSRDAALTSLNARLEQMRTSRLSALSPRSRRLHDALEQSQRLDRLRRGRRQARGLPAGSRARLWDGETLHPPHDEIAEDYLDDVLGTDQADAAAQARHEARLRRRHPERYAEEEADWEDCEHQTEGEDHP